MSGRPGPTLRGLKTLLALGFLLLGLGVLAARADPATGYEVSIYRATTLGFWLGTGLALLVSVVVLVYAGRGRLGALGLLLSGMSVTAIAALPVMRAYRFHGLADPLTHLGWARALRAGEMSGLDLIYPGGHLASVMIGQTGGISIPRAMMLVVLAVVVAYLVFVPLTLRALVPDRIAVIAAAISGYLLLPLNGIATNRFFHPYSLGMLLFPLLLFLLFKHITGDADDGSLPGFTSAAGLLLPVAAAGLLFINPQVALNVLIFFGTIVAVQFAFRRLRPNHQLSRYRAIYGQTIFLAVLFFAWNLQFWQTYNMLEGLVVAIGNTIAGTGTFGEIVQTQEQSVSQIGVSMEELFVKLFLVSAAYVALSVGLVAAKLARSLRGDQLETDVVVTYFAASGVTLGPFFLAHYLGDISHYFFRHLGFAMVFATILGASALYLLHRSVPAPTRRALRPVAVIVVIVVLVLSLVVVYQSPYIYKQNHHVSDQTMGGYGTTFANAPDVPADSEDAVWFAAVRTGPARFSDAHGVDNFDGVGGVDEAVLASNLPAHLATESGPDTDRDFYLPVSELDREREIQAYREIRYSRAAFEGITTQRGVHRVQANGEYTLYYVDTSAAET